MKLTIILMFAMITLPAHSFTDGSGWVQVTYLVKLLEENYRRYEQLKALTEGQEKDRLFLDKLHAGLNNVSGIIHSTGVVDKGSLSQIDEASIAVSQLSALYGQAPNSPDKAIQLLQDQSVGESVAMIGQLAKYVSRQREASLSLRLQAREASPKGAARMSVESTTLVADNVAQLITLEGQKLKVQGELLALENKREKDQARSLVQVNQEFKKAFLSLRPENKFYRRHVW